jgi:membrane fusion protein (multidrug efflux system)
MAFSRRFLTAVTLLLVVGLLAGGVWYRLRPTGESDPSEAGDADLPEVSATRQFATNVAQPVSGAVVRRDTLWITVTAAGQAEAIREAVLTARVEGVVEDVLVMENDAAEQGRALLQIDSTEYAMEAARARGDQVSAEARFLQSTLFDDEIEDPEVRAQRTRLARSVSGLDQADVDLERALLDLERTTVRAPFAGRIADLAVDPGQFVSVGDELMTVVDLDPIKVEVQVLEAEVGFLEEGRSASVVFAAYAGEAFSGRIVSINPRVDPETRTARVTLHLPNPDGRIKPGMYARVSLDAQSYPDRVLVPRSALLERDRRPMLFVYDGDEREGRAEWRYVCPGLESDSIVEVLSPCDEGEVAPGEVVLVDGHHYLVHDAMVRLVENPSAEGGRPGR